MLRTLAALLALTPLGTAAAEANMIRAIETQVCPSGYANELDCQDITYQVFRGIRAAGMENARLTYAPNVGSSFTSGRITLTGKRRKCAMDIVGYTVVSHCP
jgi:hypothetical protein